MGRPRKAIEPENLQPEKDKQPKNNPKVVEVKHKTEWSELRPVDTEEATNSELELLDLEEDDKPRRKLKNERDELRKKLAKEGVTPGSNLKLSIEKYRHAEGLESGMWAETESCTNWACSEAQITSDAYLDVARNYGPGRYRFTLRMNNKIVTAWDKWITAPFHNPAQFIQHAIPGDPTSQQIVVQMPEGQQQHVAPIDPFKEAERALNLVKKYNEAFGAFHPAQTGATPPRSEEEVLASALLSRPEVIENVVGSVVKRFGGSVGTAEDPAPWWAGLATEVVKSGQLGQIVTAVIDAGVGAVKNLFAGGQQNGQAQMVPPPPQNQAPAQSGEPINGALPGVQMGQQDQTAMARTVAGDVHPGNEGQNTTPAATPEEQALLLVIDHCQKKIPPQITCETLLDTADAWLDQGYSINGYIKYFASMPVDSVLEFVKTLPNGEAVIALEHAKEWTEQLQALIRESQEGSEE